MKFCLPFFLFLSLIVNVFALKIGDSRDSVIAELGEPKGTMSIGTKEVLSYKGGNVKLKDGKVVSYTANLKKWAKVYEKQDQRASDNLEAGKVFYDGRWMTESERAKLIEGKNKHLASGGNSDSSAGNADWQTDFDAALKMAKAQNKPLFLNFTGSDWCGWCVKLDKEVFSTSQFKQYAAKNVILVKLDFPKKKKQSASVKAQNEQLAKRYGIRGFPTCVILNQSGKEIGRMGYMRGGPSAFISALDKQIK